MLRQPVVALEVWACAAAVVVGSVVIGAAASVVCRPCRAAAPAVGLAALIVGADLAIRLPGSAMTAAVVLLLLVLVCGWVAIRDRPPLRRDGPPLRVPVVGLVVTGLAAFGAAIPFIANDRIGLLGVSLDNDTATHLIYAQALRSAVTRRIYGLSSGYPLGPHSLADALSSGLGARLDLAFTGLMVAIVVVSALLASRAIPQASAWKRVAAGVVVALFYLVAAYYAEAAFKEQLMGMLLLAFVLQFEEVSRDAVAGFRRLALALVPAALLVAAGVYTYSYLAVAWFGLTLGIWLVVEVAVNPGRLRRWREQLHDLGLPALAAAGVLIVLLLPTAGRIVSFYGTVGVSPSVTGAIPTSNVGNLPHALSAYEALGIWTSNDFRLISSNVFHAGELGAFALAVLILGLCWSLARREWLLPAAIAACAFIYWRATINQSFYVSAKGLVIAGPVVAVCGLRGLLGPLPRGVSAWLRVPRFAAAVAFIALALYSSYQALRDEPVWPSQSTDELLALAPLTHGQTVLFLGNTDYAEWLFDDSRMSALAITTNNLGQAAPRRGEPVVYATALDFDSVDPGTLNSFDWVITTNTAYASQAPPAFRLVRRLPMYQLWQRVGTVRPRLTLEPPGSPGAVLNCRTRAGRAISRARGVAAVMTRPVLPPLVVTAVPPGGSIRVGMGLSPGVWQLSLQYVSADPLRVSAGHLRVSADLGSWTMPAYLDRPGPWFAVGNVTATGAPTVITINADRPSALTGPDLNALIYGLVAVRLPATRTLLPLSRACGQYVDWYQVS